jgi:hypothetical protein
MANSGLALAESLFLQEAASPDGRRRGKTLVLLSLLLGVGFVVIYSQGGPQQQADELLMPAMLQPRVQPRPKAMPPLRASPTPDSTPAAVNRREALLAGRDAMLAAAALVVGAGSLPEPAAAANDDTYYNFMGPGFGIKAYGEKTGTKLFSGIQKAGSGGNDGFSSAGKDLTSKTSVGSFYGSKK